MDLQQIIVNIALSLVFALLGFVLLFIGYRVFDRLIPSDITKCIFEDGNVAAAILAGAFVLGLAVIIAMAIN